MTGVARALPRDLPLPGPGSDEAAAPVPPGAAAASAAPAIRAVPAVLPDHETAGSEVAAPDPEPVVTDVAVSAPEVAVSTPEVATPATEPAGRRDRRGTGARERRRQETRARIVDAAAELFAERGFESVSVMEIAKRAGVVEKTVFNHFPVKEGLVFEADPPMRAALLDAVRRRPAGESVAAAAGSFVVGALSLLGSPQAASGIAQMARVIRGSRTLQVREREILGELTNSLAGLIAEETGARPGAVEPWLAAHAVLGLYASLLERARDMVLAGVEGPQLAAELRRQGGRGLALLQFGLAGYAKRR